MTFKDGQPIYLQIAERLCDEILAGTYPPDTRIPGVREYSALLEVNVNTTVKAFDALAQRDVIYSKRGMGYFVTPDARERIAGERRKHFREHAMPEFFERMRQLDISMYEMNEAFKAYEKLHAKGTEARHDNPI